MGYNPRCFTSIFVFFIFELFFVFFIIYSLAEIGLGATCVIGKYFTSEEQYILIA
jgi:hypothetical protein